MTSFKAIILSAAALAVSACSISVTEDGVNRRYYDNDHDRITVTLPGGDRDRFTCPPGTVSFVVNRTDEGLGMAYGCRTNGTPVPSLEGGE